MGELGFGWSKKRERAALLVAEDELSDGEIAAECGISRRSLEYWKKRSEFAARVEEHKAAWRERVRAEGIANRQNRVDALNERWALMQRVVQERALDGTLARVPGGQTGLLVRSHRVAGSGPGARVVEEFSVDTGLLKEFRAHEEQAAKELGQWIEKEEHRGETLVREYVGVAVEGV